MCVDEVFLTWTPAQVFDVDLLLLHAGGLPDQTGVVVGVAVGGAHRVLVVAAAVDVTYTPVRAGGEREQGAGGENRKWKTGACSPALRHTHHTSSESSSHSAPYLQVLHLVNFLPTSEPEPSSSVGQRGRK